MDQEQRRAELYGLLGDLPPRDRPVSAELVAQEDRGNYLLEKLLLDLNGREPVPAYFVKPKTPGVRFPIILYNHSHGGNYVMGKTELLTAREYLQAPSYAEALTAAGYAVLCADMWLFGERRGRTESELFKEMLWKGQVLWGMMVYDTLRALDYVITRGDVDPERIGTTGISLGSTLAWWSAALDPRIKVCVDLCCLTDFQALIESRGLDGHGIYYYVPRLLKHFTTAQINTLIAPRPHLALAGNLDPLTPSAGLDRIDAELRRVYDEMGAGSRWRMVRSETAHYETAKMRSLVLSFFAAWL